MGWPSQLPSAGVLILRSWDRVPCWSLISRWPPTGRGLSSPRRPKTLPRPGYPRQSPFAHPVHSRAGGPGPVRGTPQAPEGRRKGCWTWSIMGPGGGAVAQFSRHFGPGGRQQRLRGGCEMRSEKEGVGGSGVAVAARDPSGREKLSAGEVQFRRESPRREPEVPPTSSFGCGGGTGKPREEKKTVLSKVGGGRAGQTNLARGGGSSTGWVEARTEWCVQTSRDEGWSWARGGGAKGWRHAGGGGALRVAGGRASLARRGMVLRKGGAGSGFGVERTGRGRGRRVLGARGRGRPLQHR